MGAAMRILGPIMGIAGNAHGAGAGARGGTTTGHRESTTTTSNTYFKDKLFRKQVVRPFIKQILAGGFQDIIAGRLPANLAAVIRDTANVSYSGALEQAKMRAAASGRNVDSGSFERYAQRLDREKNADINRQSQAAFQGERDWLTRSMFGIMDRPTETTQKTVEDSTTKGSGGNPFLSGIGAGLSTAGSYFTGRSMMDQFNQQQAAMPPAVPMFGGPLGPPGGQSQAPGPLYGGNPFGDLGPAPNPQSTLMTPWSSFR